MSEYIKTEEQLQDAYVSLTRSIVVSFSDPANWPLREEEKNSFMRQTYCAAKRIQDSEPFAKRQLAMALNRGRTPRVKKKSGVRVLR